MLLNDSPTISTNTGMTVDEGSTSNTITSAMLNEGDVDDDGTGLTYTITSPTTNGVVRLSGVALGLNDTFTQADIDSGLITYDHNGSETTSDSLGLSLSDGGEDGATPASGVFSIVVNPVNEQPTDITPNSFNVNEHTDTSGGNSLGVLTATDPDLGDSATFTIVGGADAALFSIGGGTGNELVLDDGVLDFESKSSYDVRIRVTDSGGLFYEENLLVNVVDLNEAPSIALTNLVSTLAEDADTTTGIRVADIVINDDALGTNVLSLSGADAGLFEIVGNELRIRSGSVLDYESFTSLDVTVEIDDAAVGATPDDTASHSINLTDVDEFDVTLPVDVDGALNSVAEKLNIWNTRWNHRISD